MLVQEFYTISQVAKKARVGLALTLIFSMAVFITLPQNASAEMVIQQEDIAIANIFGNTIGESPVHADSQPWFERLPAVQEDSLYNISIAVIKVIRNVVGFSKGDLAVLSEKALAQSPQSI